MKLLDLQRFSDACAKEYLDRLPLSGPVLYDQFGRPIFSARQVKIGDTITVRKPERFGPVHE